MWNANDSSSPSVAIGETSATTRRPMPSEKRK